MLFHLCGHLDGFAHQAPHHLVHVQNDAVQVQHLGFQDLLAFSRKQVLKPKVLDLNSIVLNMDKMVRRLMSETVEMTTKVEKHLAAVKADPGQIEQVILNLIVNARDAMPDGGRLWIETKNVELNASFASDQSLIKPGSYVMLSVMDTGVGISPDTLPHIFEPFYTTKESSRGTGLGLSTVYGIVKQRDRKSTRLNSSHGYISYAVFCLKKKNY